MHAVGVSSSPCNYIRTTAFNVDEYFVDKLEAKYELRTNNANMQDKRKVKLFALFPLADLVCRHLWNRMVVDVISREEFAMLVN